MTTLAVTGGTLVREDGMAAGDLLVRDGRIVAVSLPGALPRADERLDASGCLVLPGGVDPHAHILEGLPHAAEGALLGGTTTVCAYAPPDPGERVEDACRRWRDRLQPGVACDTALHATVYQPAALDEDSFAALAGLGVTGIKLFLAYRELGMEADDGLVVDALGWGRAHGVVPFLHCENGAVVDRLRRQLVKAGETGAEAHARSRPPLAEEEAVRRMLDLARLFDAAVYVVHVSTAGGVEALRRARADGLRVVGETCPQYLFLDEGEYRRPRAERYVISPPLRSQAHVDAVWAGVADGTLSTVGSDHVHVGRRTPAPFHELLTGGPGVGARLPLLLSVALRDGPLDLPAVVRLACGAPARALGLPGKGRLDVGADADLVVYDPTKERPLTPEILREGLDDSGWSSTVARGRARDVLLRGRPVVRGAKLVDGESGRFVAREPARWALPA